MECKVQLEKLAVEIFCQEGDESVVLVYLFGSRVEYLTRTRSQSSAIGPLSDYDFGIFIPYASEKASEFGFNEKFKLQSQLADALDAEVDLVILNRAPIEFQYNVITFGVLLFERSVEERVEYESKVLSRYGDYLPVLRQQKEDIIRGGSDEARVQRYRKALGKTERVLEQARASQGEIAGGD